MTGRDLTGTSPNPSVVLAYPVAQPISGSSPSHRSCRSRKERVMHELTGRTHWHEPTGQNRAGFGKFGRPKTPYDLFMESEGIPIYRDIGLKTVKNLPLAPWKRLGGRGTYIQLYGTEGLWGCYVVEIPAAGALNVERHLYEKVGLVVEGRGTTEVWQEGQSRRHVFEWQAGSLFTTPLNASHRLVNAANSPALLLLCCWSVTARGWMSRPRHATSSPSRWSRGGRSWLHRSLGVGHGTS